MIANLVAERLLLTLWVGSLWAVGYLAVPMAFATLGDVTLAGNYAGKLFAIVNILGIGCGTVLLMSSFVCHGKLVTKYWRFWVLLLMVVLSLVFSRYLLVEIAEIKPLISQEDDAILNRFALFHTISKNLYLVLSLLGLALVVSSDKPTI